MTEKCGNSWKVIFEPQESSDENFDNFAENFFDVVAIDYTDDEKQQYIGYLSEQPDEQALSEQARLNGITLPPHHCEFIPATNWLTANVIKFAPIETDDFLIYGFYESQAPQTTKKTIKIYAATAFGSGQHQTTRSCLKLLSQLNRQTFVPQRILDMGCGSGILSLCACKLWPQAQALAVDIDDEAVTVTLQNATDNQLAGQIHAVQSNGFSNRQIATQAPYQLVFANILARPLIDMADDLSANLAVGGYAILSGFVEDQVDWVINAYYKNNLQKIATIADENWRAVLLEKVR